LGSRDPTTIDSPKRAAISRGELAKRTIEVLNRGNLRNPDVLLVEDGGRQIVVKDFGPRSAWVRASIGRWITAREVRALRALDGLAAVPRFLGSIDALAFAVEYRPGRRMSRKLAGRVPPDFLERLETALREMHRRGVAHLDLRHRSNVLVGENGEPILIDFGSAITFRPSGLLGRWLLPLLGRLDRAALEKWRVRLTPPSAGPDSGPAPSR
jgi:predicted Ser/Thr protein kinase